MKVKPVYLFDSDGFFNDTSVAQSDPKSGKLLIPDNSTETAPDIQDGYFAKWDGKKWADIAKPETLDDCVKIGKVSHSSQTAHDRELRAIFRAIAQNSETHEVRLIDDFWSMVKKPEKSAEEKAKEEKERKVAKLKQKLSETDYVVIKIAEGEATKEEYSEVLANRKAWREAINQLEGE